MILELERQYLDKVLPTGWAWKKLENIAQDARRFNPKKDAPQNYFQYIDISSVDNQKGEIKAVKKILGEDAPSRARKVVRTDSIIVATTRPYLRNIAIVDSELDQAISSTGFCVLNVIRESALPKYIYYFCRSNLFIQQLIPKQRGANYPAVTDQDIFDSVIPIPCPEDPVESIEIQRRIVTRIEALLHEIKESRKICDRIYQDAKRLLEVAINEVFTKLESVIETVSFQDIGTAFNGRASGSGKSNVRVFKTRHTYPHKLRLGDPSYAKPEEAPKWPRERFLRPGDALMANIAEGTLGRVSYVHECEENWTVDTQIMILRSKDENVVLGKWIYYYFWSERGQREILSRRTGIAFADKRGQTHIYPRDVQTIPFPKVPINSQRQAVAYLDTVLNESEKMTELVHQDIKTLDLLEQSILDRAFRGEL
ncbi:restriction endonuclease subunit S [Nodosilinea sp. AN01ver1]|uniref:restriction endonuclease subunit S n=1 Tax=Nodosilinea sp. AN01ver1 TaxID=3423362 RepID=UPI003D315D1D